MTNPLIIKLSQEYPLNTFSGTTLKELQDLLMVCWGEGYNSNSIGIDIQVYDGWKKTGNVLGYIKYIQADLKKKLLKEMEDSFEYKIKADVLVIPPKEVIDRLEDFKDGYNACRGEIIKLIEKI